MKITIEHHGKTLTAELTEDASITDINEVFRGMLLADGYHQDNIDETFPYWESEPEYPEYTQS